MNFDPYLEMLCANLCHLRSKYSLSKTQMARILGVGTGTVNLWERGSVPARLGSSVLYRASVYFGVRADGLLNVEID